VIFTEKYINYSFERISIVASRLEIRIKSIFVYKFVLPHEKKEVYLLKSGNQHI
jgi:hypothetical protein